jgi:SPASM domain peptide maturase of grasp-with-spasm system
MKYFKLHSNCIIQKGVTNGVIIDIQFNEIYSISNSYLDLFDQNGIIDINKQTKQLSGLDLSEFKKLIDFLEVEKLGIYINQDESCFPRINYRIVPNAEITNSIIWISSANNYESIFRQLFLLNCKAIQLVFIEKIPQKKLVEIFSSIKSKKFNSIEVYVLAKFEKEFENIINIDEWSNLRNLTYFESITDQVSIVGHRNMRALVYTQEKLCKENCGKINSEIFNTHFEFINESLHHNSCLNRKISIDAEGNIKNCPSMKKSFGNIKDTTLEEAINKKGFKKYWNINKDKIKVCQDCEYRYICTDCRAYTEDPNDIYSKPLKCGYNPYTGEWSEWSTNPLKQKAIKYYGMEDLVK